MKYYEMTAIVDNIDKIQGIIETELDNYTLSPKVSAQIAIAVEEIFLNICNHAYNGQGGVLKLGFGVEKGVITLVFYDNGAEFDPNSVVADTTGSLEERKIGGLGIHMVKKSMDSMIYRYENNQNILTLIKSI